MRRLKSATNPENGTTGYTYDDAGNLKTKTDGRGSTITYTYDNANRVISKAYSGLPTATPSVSYTYDNLPNAIGRLTSVANGNSTELYSAFDPLGRITASSQITAGQTYSFGYTYNVAGSLTTETYPSGRTINTAYDGAGRVVQMTGSLNAQSKTYAAGISYNPSGSILGIVYGNNVVPIYTYDGRLRPAAFWTTIGNDGNQFLQMLYYAWSANGNLVAHTVGSGTQVPFNSLSWVNEAFLYDNLNRLSLFEDNGGGVLSVRTFGYDTFGNMWANNVAGSLPWNGIMPTSQSSYQSNNQMAGVGYDQAGSQTTIPTLCPTANCLQFDGENQQVAYGGDRYYYDGKGRRVESQTSAGTTVYVYDAAGLKMAEYTTGAVQAPPCSTCFLVWDHLGSTRLVTDQSGNVVSRHDYLPFGEEITAGYAGRAGLFGAVDAVVNKFTGKERDAETGLDYFGARYYGSALGRSQWLKEEYPSAISD